MLSVMNPIVLPEANKEKNLGEIENSSPDSPSELGSKVLPSTITTQKLYSESYSPDDLYSPSSSQLEKNRLSITPIAEEPEIKEELVLFTQEVTATDVVKPKPQVASDISFLETKYADIEENVIEETLNPINSNPINKEAEFRKKLEEFRKLNSRFYNPLKIRVIENFENYFTASENKKEIYFKILNELIRFHFKLLKDKFLFDEHEKLLDARYKELLSTFSTWNGENFTTQIKLANEMLDKLIAYRNVERNLNETLKVKHKKIYSAAVNVAYEILQKPKIDATQFNKLISKTKHIFISHVALIRNKELAKEITALDEKAQSLAAKLPAMDPTLRNNSKFLSPIENDELTNIRTTQIRLLPKGNIQLEGKLKYQLEQDVRKLRKTLNAPFNHDSLAMKILKGSISMLLALVTSFTVYGAYKFGKASVTFFKSALETRKLQQAEKNFKAKLSHLSF